MNISTDKYKYCPACGFDHQEDIMEIHTNGSLVFNQYEYDICPCCGGEYGCDIELLSPQTIPKFRASWISDDQMKFRQIKSIWNDETQGFITISQTPENYNPITQLQNIDIDFTNQVTVEEYKKEIPNIEELIKPWVEKMQAGK